MKKEEGDQREHEMYWYDGVNFPSILSDDAIMKYRTSMFLIPFSFKWPPRSEGTIWREVDA